MLKTYMKSLGYTDKDIEKIVSNYALCKYNDEELYNKISDIFNYLLVLGYLDKGIIKMTISQPLIYGLSIESIKQKIDNLLEIGYGFEDIIKITVKFPLLFCKNISDIKIKKRFYEQIGINDLIINNPRCLAQSMKLSFARYMFYYRIGIKINRGNYMLLFMKQSEFVKKHGKTSKQLIDLYSYDEYLEKRKGLIKKR